MTPPDMDRVETEHGPTADATSASTASATSATSEGRYRQRVARFEADGKPWSKARHHALWILHNVVVHPLLGLAPTTSMAELHKLSSDWLNGQPADVFQERAPKPPNIWAWRLHNIAAHAAIGILPCAATFRLHDASARWMSTPGWV